MEPPKSWDDLAKLAAAFTDEDPDGNGRRTPRLRHPRDHQARLRVLVRLLADLRQRRRLLKANGGGKFAPGDERPQDRRGSQWLQDQFCTAKTVNPGAVSNDTTITHEVFEKGQGGIYLVGPYVLARFVKSIGTDKIEVVPVPKGPSGGPGTLAEGENVYMMAGSDKRGRQQKFAEYAVSPDGQRVGMNRDANGAIVRLPVNTQVDMAAERQDPRWKVFQEAYADAVYAPPVPNWAPFRQDSADSINTVWADCSADVKTAMDTLNTKLTQELQTQKAS